MSLKKKVSATFLGLVALVALILSWTASISEEAALFQGKISFNAKDSVPHWPEVIKAPEAAPNIVLILLDDIGFADSSTFGGVAQTPELERLAASGLRYNNFNVTAMCSPTRAALLSGRNHHRVGFGIIADAAGGYPGYNSIWKKSTASIPEILRLNGYSTAAFGKWHNTPDWEITPTGPFDRWPTGLGFEYFYGFMGPAGDENQWEPTRLYRDTTPVDPPATPENGYHLTTDIVNDAIRWIDTHETLAPEKPYFLYFATGAVHVPHHVPKEWIAKYRGKFDSGWDELNRATFDRQKRLGVIPANAKLTPRPREVPAWASLTADQKRLYARQMEVYAGFIAHTDHEVGRLLRAIRSGPHGDNTLVLYIVGDNGAGNTPLDGFTSGSTTIPEQIQRIDELGSPAIPMNGYSLGWAWAGDTPFRYWKTVASHFGGTRDPLIVSWPKRIKDKGGLRTQFTHVNDVAPTLYDVIGITAPAEVSGTEQQAFDGVSFAQTFDEPGAPSNHHTQYFELLGNRALYQDGWVAAAKHVPPGWNLAHDDFSRDRWELYHVSKDFSEAEDVAEKYPQKLEELRALFDVEARKNDVYPLGALGSPGKPSLTAGKEEFVFYPPTLRIPEALLPRFWQSSYRITADVIVPKSGAEGVIDSYGDRAGGFVFYVKGGHLIYESRSGTHLDVITSSDVLPRGPVSLAFEFDRKPLAGNKVTREPTSGTGRLYINGKISAEAFLPAVWAPDNSLALFIGRGGGSPVSHLHSRLSLRAL